MKNLCRVYILIAALVLFAGIGYAQQPMAAHGFCTQGNGTVTTLGYTSSSSTLVMRSYPQCTVEVFIAGTVTHPTNIFSDSSGTPKSNPFNADVNGFWSFYGVNGYYDVRLSGAGIPTPYTIPAVGLINFTTYQPGGVSGSVQYANNGLFAGDTNFTWTAVSKTLSITGSISISGNATNLNSTGGGLIQSDGSIKSTYANWQSLYSPSGGLWAASLSVGDNQSNLAGGYLIFRPITYNPNDGPPQFDQWNNPLRIPMPISGDTFGPNDLLMWNGESPVGGSLPVNLIYGINTNGYFFGRGGLATDQPSYNSVQSLVGGMYANSFTALHYVQLGTSAGPPAPTQYDQFHGGAIYWDTVANALRVFNGASWTSIGGGGGGAVGGADTNVQFNSLGSLGGSSAFTWNSGLQLVTVTALDAAHAGIAVATGYVQADAGFLATAATANKYNSFYAPSGGMAANSFTAVNYIQTGSHNGAPSLSTNDSLHPGAMYWDTGANAEKVYNGSSWLTLGGGAGSPGGATKNVQYNNAGALAGSNNFNWDNTAQLLTATAVDNAHAGIAVATGFMQADAGFLATPGTATNYNAIQANGGGMAAKSFTATAYVQVGHGTTNPTLTTNDTFHAGALYWNDTSANMQVYNGSAWVALTGGGAGTPGGANTNVQYNASGAFGGSSNFVWNNASQLLTITATGVGVPGIVVGTGFVQADDGFLATAASALKYNEFQAPGGGMAAKSFTATAYIQTGHSTGAPSVTLNDTFHAGAMYWDDGANVEKVYNGTTWTSLSGGGGGSPGGSDTYVQFNSAGSFGGSSFFTWNTTNRVLTVSATSSSVAGIVVGTGFMQADAGFLATGATATNYNAIQAPGGGLAGRSMTATTYIQSGQSSGIPAVTNNDAYHPGAMYWDTSLGSERVYNGSTWLTIATGAAGGVTSLNGLSGGLTISGTSSQVNVTSGGSTIVLSTPQNIATTSAVTFASVNTTGAVQSQSSGAAIAFQTSNFNFQVDGNGNVSALTQYNVTGGSGTYKMLGNTIVDANRYAYFQSLYMGGNLIINSSGAVQSPVTGTGVTFQNSNFNFQVNGNGDISGAGSLNLTGGGSLYKMGGTTVINTAGAFVGPGVNVGSYGVSAGNYNVNGGYIGQTATVYIPGGFTIGGNSYHYLYFQGGIMVSFTP